MAGNPDTYFKPFASRLDRFVLQHNLKVEKYRHGMARWNLFFQHPLGGCGRIDVGTDGQVVSLIKWWILDDYELLRRKSRSMPPYRIANPVDCLEERLSEAIKDVLTWSLNELEDQGEISPGPWRDDSAARPTYPVVKI